MRTRINIVIPALSILAVAVALASWGIVVAQSDVPQQSPCANAYVTDLWAEVETDLRESENATVWLEWSFDIAPWPDGLDDVAFRIDRRAADDDEWELIESAYHNSQYTSAVEPGRWVYWVSIASITVDGAEEQCASDTGYETKELSVPTHGERVQETLKELCNAVEVFDLRAVMPETGGPDSALMLKWEDGAEYLYEDDWPFLPSEVHYRVERVAAADGGSEDSWETLADTTEQIWSGPADFGQWIYRVGTIRLEGGGAIQDCQPWWAEVEVRILTEEEKAEQERRLGALKSETVRCGTERLTGDIQGEARQVVADYVAERVDEIVSAYEDYSDPDEGLRSLVALTVLICADDGQPSPYGVNFGSTWTTLMLLEEGNIWGW